MVLVYFTCRRPDACCAPLNPVNRWRILPIPLRRLLVQAIKAFETIRTARPGDGEVVKVLSRLHYRVKVRPQPFRVLGFPDCVQVRPQLLTCLPRRLVRHSDSAKRQPRDT